MQSRLSAFTLLETLLAVLIFSIVVTALYSTFRIGMRAYEVGQRNIDVMQKSRFVFDMITKDLRTVYYEDESNYNITFRQHVQQFENEMERARHEGRLDEFLERIEDENYPNPYSFSSSIDLSFKGVDDGGSDGLSFVVYRLTDGKADAPPWGLARITYAIENERLVRTTDDVFLPEQTKEGEEIPKPEPLKATVAEGVKQFDLKYGYFYDIDWYEADDWNSSEKKYRNPAPEVEEDDPNYAFIMQLGRTRPADGLPAYVAIDLILTDASPKARERHFQSLVRIPKAEETYLPLKEEYRPERGGIRY